ncbi:LAETG motif-containing sortase-dependent surface protein [Streptomyces radiopugnans]|uniref:LPXTG-motif cell wall anchor domain-containing protein n=1 Tax=Streptomyces radiopugnans TaxID=403935 RepID=A0A1H9HSX9_9ACTN|nr:LAETG motif-containing sortase-dependent surface protein [Streptomyces radiopugnans]SEQ65366.1 LPXTG-motif cell wall anchor domain-containing protein [Streptomyces radiopugnans]
MKLRRALAAAAATAVIAPVALIAAPAAYADGHETTSVENTETPAPEKTEGEETEPPAADGGTEGGDTEPPATDETGGEETDNPGETEDDETEPPATDETGGEETDNPGETEDEDSDTPGGDEGKDGEEDSDAPGGDEGKDEEEAPFQCAVDDNGEEIYDISEDLKTSLVGLPDTVVAGTGWKNFEFRMHNSGKGAIKDVAPYITVFSGDENNDYSAGFTLEVHKAETGTWQVVADELGAGGYFEPVTLNSGETRTLKLRMKIDGGVPDSLGIAIGAGEYSDERGCWVSDDDNGWVYFFEVLGKGAAAPKPGESKPKPQTGGAKPISSDKVTKVDTAGQLAETGSSSALPMFGLAGAAAVALGAGAMYVVRRRNGAGADTSAAA